MRFKNSIYPVDNKQPRGKPSSAVQVNRRTLMLSGAGVAALTLAGCGGGGGSDSPIPNAGKREYSFDEDWRFMRGDLTGAEVVAYNDSAWRSLDVPHDWRVEDLSYAASTDSSETKDPATFLFTTKGNAATMATRSIGSMDVDADPVLDLSSSYGPLLIKFPGGKSQGYTVGANGWYRKSFTVPPGLSGTSTGQRVELRFDGVFFTYDIYINGHHLAFNANGYCPGTFDITPYLSTSGNNVVALSVKSKGKTSRWLAGSGIYRHCWITVTHPVHIPYSGVYVTTPYAADGASVANIVVSVQNASAAASSAKVRVTAIDPSGKEVASETSSVQSVAANAMGSYAFKLAIPDALLWSPASPSLYQLRSEVLVDDKSVDVSTTTFGIRSLAFSGDSGLVLNGQRIVVRGACIHHDHGALGARAFELSDFRRVKILKDAGFNAIRGSHNPHSPAVMDACDQLGMLFLAEFTDMWNDGKLADDYSLYFADNWRKDLTSFVLRDRNHPCVVIWSLGNEISGDQFHYGTQMSDVVHALDRTRPVMLGGSGNVSGMKDASIPYTDIGDYHYDVPSKVEEYHTAYPSRAICRSETHGTEIYEFDTYDNEHKFMIGSFAWTGWDYIGESGVGSGVVATGPGYGPGQASSVDIAYAGMLGYVEYPWYGAYTGDIDMTGQRKPQNYFRHVVYGLSPVEIMVLRPAPVGKMQFMSFFAYYDELPSWTWDVAENEPMRVRVLTSADSVTLLLNGALLETRALTPTDKFAAEFSVPYKAGTLTAVVSKNGAEVARKTLTTVGAPAALRLTSEVPSLTTSRADLAHVLVEVVDSQGRLVPDAVVHVTMAATGAGALIAVNNGNMHNPDSFIRGDRWTFHGRAQAVLRPGKSAGTLNMTATSPGLQSGSLSLVVKASTAKP